MVSLYAITGAIFNDLTKAAGFVDGYLLLDKIHGISLSNNAVLWFNSCLHNRKQCVIVKGNQSDLLIQQRGVPQGSTLGPLLFSIYVNDLPSCLINRHIQLYADDTVIYTSKPDLPQIQISLQSDFNILQDWLSYNKLLLKKTKSYIMTFVTRKKLKSKLGSFEIRTALLCIKLTTLHILVYG